MWSTAPYSPIYPQSILKKGYLFCTDYLEHSESIAGEHLSITIWTLFNEYKMPFDNLFVIAHGINWRVPGNNINWKSTFEYLGLLQLRYDQEKIYDGGKKYIPTSEWGAIEREIIIHNIIRRTGLDKKMLEDVNTRLKELKLVE